MNVQNLDYIVQILNSPLACGFQTLIVPTDQNREAASLDHFQFNNMTKNKYIMVKLTSENGESRFQTEISY